MAFSLLPREVKFFDLFDRQSEMILSAAACFKEMIHSGSFDEDRINKMRDIEHAADDITHDIIKNLNITFITPFDREDIHALAHELDNVVDTLYTTSKRLRLYKLNEINDDLIQFFDIIEQSTNALTKALNGLRNSKHPKQMLDYCIEVHRLENVGDHYRDSVIQKLFENTTDPITIIKWKEVYECAETILDICEDVAHVIESIMVKQG